MHRLINITTYLQLDSQLPKSLTIRLAQHAALLLMICPVMHNGLETTGFQVYFKTEFNLTMLKRIGCMVYYRLEKEQRVKFGAHGALAVLVGLNRFKFPDFTCQLYIPKSRQTIFRRDLLIVCRGVHALQGRESHADYDESGPLNQARHWQIKQVSAA